MKLNKWTPMLLLSIWALGAYASTDVGIHAGTHADNMEAPFVIAQITSSEANPEINKIDPGKKTVTIDGREMIVTEETLILGISGGQFVRLTLSEIKAYVGESVSFTGENIPGRGYVLKSLQVFNDDPAPRQPSSSGKGE